MPHTQLMTERANEVLKRDMLEASATKRGAFDSNMSLTTGLRELGIIRDSDGPELAGMISLLPHSIQETLRATVVSALDRRVPAQIVWLPGHGYEVTVAEAVGVDAVTTAISVVLRTPYPLPESGPGSAPKAT